MAYINQNGVLINSEIVTCFDGAICHIDETVYVESINHFAQYSQVIAGENGYELLPELMTNLRNDANFVDCEKTVRILNKELSQLRDSNKRGLFLEAHKKRDEAMKKLSKTLHYSIGEKTMTTQLFFCEFKGYIATAFSIAQLDLDYSDLDCLFDLYEAYLNSNASIYHFVNSNFNAINARINLI